MSASVGDRITDTRNAARPNSARVSSGRSAGGATLACDNLVGWPTASKVHFVTYRIDSNSSPVAGTQLDCYGIVSGNNIGSLVVVDGTDAGNSVNDVVEMLPTAAWGQDLSDALMSQHTRTGAHGAITATSIATTGSVAAGSGLTVSAGSVTLPSASISQAALPLGAVAQVVNTTSGAVATGTTVIPLDDTIPQNTEGDQYMTLAITPKAATNILVVEATITLASSAINNLMAALFQDATANALAVTIQNQSGTNQMATLALCYTMAAGTTSSTTFKVRGGGNAAGTTTFNGVSAGRLFGGAIQSSIVITEYKA
jgi:hypothetical protein